MLRTKTQNNAQALNRVKPLNTEQVRLPTYKITIIGAGGVGKTALIDSFARGKTDLAGNINLGSDLRARMFANADHSALLNILDVIGHGRYSKISDSFFKGVHAVAMLYDVTAPSSFFDLMYWRDMVQGLAPLVPMMVVGNKVDFAQVVPADEARGWAESLAMPFCLVCAKSGEGVAEMFGQLERLASQEYERRRG
jgi:small GTP-binding protein